MCVQETAAEGHYRYHRVRTTSSLELNISQLSSRRASQLPTNTQYWEPVSVTAAAERRIETHRNHTSAAAGSGAPMSAPPAGRHSTAARRTLAGPRQSAAADGRHGGVCSVAGRDIVTRAVNEPSRSFTVPLFKALIAIDISIIFGNLLRHYAKWGPVRRAK